VCSIHLGKNLSIYFTFSTHPKIILNVKWCDENNLLFSSPKCRKRNAFLYSKFKYVTEVSLSVDSLKVIAYTSH